MAYHTSTDILLSNSLENLNKQPVLVTSTGAGSIPMPINRVTFINSGAIAVTITVNGVANTVPAAARIEFEAGGNGNKFPIGEFSWDATGGSLIVAYVY